MSHERPARLNLLRESKIRDLLRDAEPPKRFEASGVLVKDGYFFVVFDDRTQVARITTDLQASEENQLFGARLASEGYEGISYNHGEQRFYLLVEMREGDKGSCRAAIVEYDLGFNKVEDRPLDFAFESKNKGFEAVAFARRENTDYVLALCEGNMCRGGEKGKQPGGGRVQVFEKQKERWSRAATIAPPENLPFIDYSGMAIDANRVAVVSQVNSMLWIGEFDEAKWTWRDAGRLYEFPRNKQGAIKYGNVEGVGWITRDQIVAVSDKRKKSSQPDKKLSKKDQSIHVFHVPS